MLYHLFRTLKYWIISAVKLSTRGSSHIFWKSHDWESNIVTEKGEESLCITSTDYAILTRKADDKWLNCI